MKRDPPLAGKAVIEAKKKHNIGPLKKEQAAARQSAAEGRWRGAGGKGQEGSS